MGNKSSCCNPSSPAASTTCRVGHYTNVDANHRSISKRQGNGANGGQVNSTYLSGRHNHNDYDYESSWTRDETSNNLQHISEREPDGETVFNSCVHIWA